MKTPLIPNFETYLIAATVALEDLLKADGFDFPKALRLLATEAAPRCYDEGKSPFDCAVICAERCPATLPPPPVEIIVPEEGTESVEASRLPDMWGSRLVEPYRPKLIPGYEGIADRCGGIDEVEDDEEEHNPDDGPDLSNAHCIVDNHFGIYCPQTWAERVNREFVTGVTAEDWAILEAGPDHEWYWETWSNVENNALVIVPNEGVYEVYQDGDIWHVPVPPARAEEALRMAKAIASGEAEAEALPALRPIDALRQVLRLAREHDVARSLVTMPEEKVTRSIRMVEDMITAEAMALWFVFDDTGQDEGAMDVFVYARSSDEAVHLARDFHTLDEDDATTFEAVRLPDPHDQPARVLPWTELRPAMPPLPTIASHLSPFRGEAEAAPDDVEGWAKWINEAAMAGGLSSEEFNDFVEEHIDKAHTRAAITWETAKALARRFDLKWEEATPMDANPTEARLHDTLSAEDIHLYAVNTSDFYARHKRMAQRGDSLEQWRKHVRDHVLPRYAREHGGQVDWLLGAVTDAARSLQDYYHDHLQEG